jgi:predicted MFS family arabinose efflux permease
VQTPTGAGYGFGESPLVAGSLLVPFSFASFAANKAAGALLRRRGPDTVVVAGCVLLVAAMAQFRLGRGTLWELGIAMALAGFGVGWVFAANPLQLVRGVPPHETGSATGFYQVVRSTGFALGSALSATVLTSATPRGRSIPASSGYDTAAVLGICALIVATAVSAAFLRPAKTASQSPPAPAPAARSTR